ncbi:hypothetical protein [Shimia sp.]|uniref:hypothetical protein n=1 Tax=Shimia sp. TaxID=1954381 RepID=UPI003B8E7965
MRASLLTPYLAAWALALAVGAFFYGKSEGRAACESEHARAVIAQREAGDKLMHDRQIVERKVHALSRQLEEQAYADPVVVERCLSPRRVQRLNAIR